MQTVNIRRILSALYKGTLVYLIMSPVKAESDNLVQEIIEGFQNSNIEFQRGNSHVPFFPLALLGAKKYGDFEVAIGDNNNLKYDVEHFSQTANLPILLNDNNVLIVGEYLARTHFSHEGNQQSAVVKDNFTVDSIGIPIAWMNQLDPNWQVGGFVMPLAHKTSNKDADWNWEYLGGAFGRYVQSDHLWWAFGFYANATPGDNTYLPYLGASWTVNDHWTLSAIMPWPAVLYAPTDDWLVRLGASPSGASWQLDTDSGSLNNDSPSGRANPSLYEPTDAFVNFDAWDFGLSVEHRLAGNFWLGAEAGIGGLRGLRVTGGNLHGVDTQVSSSGYIGLNINFRPSIR